MARGVWDRVGRGNTLSGEGKYLVFTKKPSQKNRTQRFNQGTAQLEGNNCGSAGVRGVENGSRQVS